MKVKICTKCGKELPATIEYFSKMKKGKYGLRADCKKCNSVYRKKHYDKNKKQIREKQNKYFRLYYAKNKEQICEDKKEYYKENRERILDYSRQYHEENRDSIIEYQKEYRAKNKLRIRTLKKEYKKRNKELVKMEKQRRKHKLRGLPRTLTVQQWANIQKDFGNACCYCGKKKELEKEHFIPLKNGGEFTHNNIIPSCKSCNSSKSDRDFFEWYRKYKYYDKNREKAILDYLGYDEKTQQLALF